MNLNEYVGNDFLLYNGNTLHVGNKNILLRNVKLYETGGETSTYPNLGRFVQTGSGAVNKFSYNSTGLEDYVGIFSDEYTNAVGFAIKRWQAKVSNNAVNPGIFSLRPVYKLIPTIGCYHEHEGIYATYPAYSCTTNNYIINSLTNFSFECKWYVGGKTLSFNNGAKTITYNGDKSGSKSFTLEKGTDIRDLELTGGEFEATTSMGIYPSTPYSDVHFQSDSPTYENLMKSPLFWITPDWQRRHVRIENVIKSASLYAYSVSNPKEWFDVPVTGE